MPRCRTRNTEYELVDDRCVAVRDLRTGRLLEGHRALGQAVRGCIRLVGPGAPSAAVGPVRRGLCLWFRGADRDVLTTPIVDVLY